jgi:hypothetical protein
MTPPIDWFRDPQLSGPTPVTVESSGRVYGHIATWDSTHMGMPGKNVRPPRSQHDYSYFMVGSTQALDGDAPVDISVGNLTLDTGHASLTSDATQAAAHYDDTGAQVAQVCAGEDAHGVWFAGAVAPGIDDLRMHKLRASAVSGDWRPVGGSLELVAALMVNTPGFPIPRARVASAAELAPLVAANVVPNPIQEPQEAPVSKFFKDDYVQITASGQIAKVVEVADDEHTRFVVEVPVSADEITGATEDQAIAASAARTERQRLQGLESRIEQLTASLEARDRADEAARLLEGIEV